MTFRIVRLDENPTNRTYGEWCHMTSFSTHAEAEAFLRRASGPTQKLRIVVQADPQRA